VYCFVVLCCCAVLLCCVVVLRCVALCCVGVMVASLTTRTPRGAVCRDVWLGSRSTTTIDVTETLLNSIKMPALNRQQRGSPGPGSSKRTQSVGQGKQ
jgi:hypothetical protein